MQNEKKQESKGLGVAGMVLGIVGFFFSWWPLVGGIMPLLALIFGLVQRSKSPDGYATAGIVLGAIGLSIQALWVLLFAALMTV
jgi:hypothetical protein